MYVAFVTDCWWIQSTERPAGSGRCCCLFITMVQSLFKWSDKAVDNYGPFETLTNHQQFTSAVGDTQREVWKSRNTTGLCMFSWCVKFPAEFDRCSLSVWVVRYWRGYLSGAWCIWPSWCHCHSLSLASVKSRLVLPFWYQLPRVVQDKGPLNVCVCVCV